MLIINVSLRACPLPGTERDVGPRAAELHLPARGAFTVHGRLDANAMRQGNLYSNKREYSIREG